MSLSIRYCSDSQMVKTIFGFRGSYGLTYTGDALQYIIHNNDLFMRFIGDENREWFSFSNDRSIGEIYGLIGFKSGENEIKVSSKPLSGPLAGSQYDYEAYGSIFHNLRLFETTITGRNFIIPSHTSESSCRHIGYSGELIAGQDALSLFSEDMNFFGKTVKVRNTHQKGYIECKVINTGPLDVVFQNNDNYDWSRALFCINDLLHDLRDCEVVDAWTWNGTYWVRTFSNLNYSSNSAGLVISYHMDVDCPFQNDRQHYTWDSTVTIHFNCVEPYRHPAVNMVLTTDVVDPVEWHFSCSTAYPWTGQMTRTEIGTNPLLEPFSQPFPFSIPSFTTVDARENSVYAAISLKTGYALQNFEDAIHNEWANIVPSSLFSTVDAFKEAEGYLDMNVLQNFAKLPDISSSLPKIREAIEILGKIAKRDLSMSTLRDILSLASSTVLQANFQWRPYYTILTDYLPRMISTLQLLGDIKKHAIGRGSFSFKLENQLGREEVTLLTRTKLVMDASSSGLLSAVLGIDALGLLPKFSNIWDLIPFSFAANWFTGVGEAMRRAEYSLLLATIPAYFVHTYTLTSPLTQSELDLMKMSGSLEYPASLRVYYRDISVYSPTPRDSKFGFGIPSGLPPIGTLGSLLYQLIFG